MRDLDLESGEHIKFEFNSSTSFRDMNFQINFNMQIFKMFHAH